MSLPTFLQDKFFLQQLDSLHVKEQFIKITVLNWKEEPLQQIQGICISGSVNLDGSSSMRRTATLSVYAEEKENNLANVDHLFSVNKKCKIQVGIKNKVENYIFVTEDKSHNITRTVIDYKKKYGEIVWFPLGLFVMFNPSLAHGMDGVTISMNLKDKMCLLNGDLGGQIHSSIDFSNLDEEVDADSTSLIQKSTLIYDIIIQLVNHWGGEDLAKIIISEIPPQIKQVVQVNTDVKLYLNTAHYEGKPQPNYTLDFEKGEEEFKQFSLGDEVGYFYTDFTYPGELVCNAGETVTSVLDKIIGVLGNYEYFYDVEGNFIFQQKRNFLNMSFTAYWQKEKDKGETPTSIPLDYYQINSIMTKPVYSFEHNKYTTAYNNSLNFNNIKNDFVVWGSRQNGESSQNRIGCRYHLAIDKKPSLNKHNIALYSDSSGTIRAVAGSHEKGEELFPNATEDKAKGVIIASTKERQSQDWREEIYYQMCEDEILGTGANTEKNNSYFQYYAQLKEEFPKIFDLEKQAWKDQFLEHPEKADYFLDFIDENSELGQYSVSNIGRRAKIIEDNNEGINCVFEPTIQDIVYVTREELEKEDTEVIKRLINYGQVFCQISSSVAAVLSQGHPLNSCFEKIKDLLYQYTHVNNTISITTLPIYYLEPNTRITVEDGPSGIHGDYIIQSISLPLDISSTMNINAYKALQKI